MRSLITAGIVLLVIAAILFYRGGGFTTEKKVAEVGDVTLKTEDHHELPKWAAPAAAVTGLVLLVAGVPRNAD
jgi:hypothetical protein